MDPLGVNPIITDIHDLPTWNVSDVPDYTPSDGGNDLLTVPFHCNPEINDKIVVW